MPPPPPPPTSAEEAATQSYLRVSTMPVKQQVDLLAQALLREFMHRKGLKETLRTFDEECARTPDTISSRMVMRQLLNVPPAGRASRLKPAMAPPPPSTTAEKAGGRKAGKGGTEGKPVPPTLMEEVCSHRLTKREYTTPGHTEEDPSDVEMDRLRARVKERETLAAVAEAQTKEGYRLLEERLEKKKARKMKKLDLYDDSTSSSKKKSKKKQLRHRRDSAQDDDDDGEEELFDDGTGIWSATFGPYSSRGAVEAGGERSNSKTSSVNSSFSSAAGVGAVGSAWRPPGEEETKAAVHPRRPAYGGGGLLSGAKDLPPPPGMLRHSGSLRPTDDDDEDDWDVHRLTSPLHSKRQARAKERQQQQQQRGYRSQRHSSDDDDDGFLRGSTRSASGGSSGGDDAGMWPAPLVDRSLRDADGEENGPDGRSGNTWRREEDGAGAGADDRQDAPHQEKPPRAGKPPFSGRGGGRGAGGADTAPSSSSSSSTGTGTGTGVLRSITRGGAGRGAGFSALHPVVGGGRLKAAGYNPNSSSPPTPRGETETAAYDDETPPEEKGLHRYDRGAKPTQSALVRREDSNHPSQHHVGATATSNRPMRIQSGVGAGFSASAAAGGSIFANSTGSGVMTPRGATAAGASSYSPPESRQQSPAGGGFYASGHSVSPEKRSARTERKVTILVD
eukprot:gene12228-8415_t